MRKILNTVKTEEKVAKPENLKEEEEEKTFCLKASNYMPAQLYSSEEEPYSITLKKVESMLHGSLNRAQRDQRKLRVAFSESEEGAAQHK